MEKRAGHKGMLPALQTKQRIFEQELGWERSRTVNGALFDGCAKVAQFGSCGSPFCSSQNQGAVGEPIAGLRGFSARPVGKRGVQSGIFEDEQEPLL